jgi:hypothetical protein
MLCYIQRIGVSDLPHEGYQDELPLEKASGYAAYPDRHTNPYIVKRVCAFIQALKERCRRSLQSEDLAHYM